MHAHDKESRRTTIKYAAGKTAAATEHGDAAPFAAHDEATTTIPASSDEPALSEGEKGLRYRK
jgi:hypothetical protein